MAVRTVMDDVLDRAIEAGRVPGVVAMAANADGLLYEGAFGKRTAGGDAAISLDTVFFLASMTKAVTCVAAMQQVERGNIDLDEPIGRIVPELADPHVLDGFDASGAPILRAARRPITLRLLLSHTSGFAYDTWNGEIRRYVQVNGIPSAGTGRRAGLMVPLVSDPGTRWEYSIGIDWAGQAVERTSGLDLEAYFRVNICEPLGMSDTGFLLRPDQRARKAGVHQRTGDTSFDVLDHETNQQPEFFPGGGGLYSVGRDYLAFLQMLLHDGTLNGAQILKSKSVTELNRNQIGDLPVTMMKSYDPRRSNDAELFPGMLKRWTLGYLMTTEQTPTGRAAGSLAWGGIANTYYWLDPATRVAGLILTQIFPFADPIVLDLFGQFERAIYDSL
ncbi:MAG TPA: serine hydrolase domain-containing protein [Chloroflexota bacterium]|nr:serine hydrolase domain-containing protein [Chloroflexota bacterium]